MRVITIIRGKSDEWLVIGEMTRDQIDAMRADGIEIDEVANTVPDWAASCGLCPIWFFAQDVWNFRNPLRRR